MNDKQNKLKDLCDKYIEIYVNKKNILEQTSVNKKTLKIIAYYLSLWNEVKAKDYIFDELTAEAKNEVIEKTMKDQTCDDNCDDCILNIDDDDLEDDEDEPIEEKE